MSTSAKGKTRGAEPSGSEKRKFQRVSRPIAAICAYTDELRRYEDACRTVNLSGGGVAIELDRNIALSTTVSVKLLVENRLLRCEGRVVRCDPPAEADDRNTVAIELTIDEDQRSRLVDFLQS